MNYYPTPYSQSYTINPPAPVIQDYRVQPQQPDTNMIWVQGISGGNAYPLQNGKSAVLFDTDSERFFIKTVDASGMPQKLRIFKYTEEINENEMKTPIEDFVTKAELNEMKDELLSAIKSIKEVKQNPNNNQERNTNKNGKPTVQ